VNGRDYTIKVNSFELGVLTGVIMQEDERTQQALKPVWEQLMIFKKQIEEESGGKERGASWRETKDYR